MKNTHENYLKLVAQYIGQKATIKYPHLNNAQHSCVIVGVDSEYIKFECPFQNYDYSDEIEPLELKNHNSLSIEDMENISSQIKGLDFDNNNPEETAIIDVLRANGVAMPYMGLTVEKQMEYGWITLINNTNE